MIKLRAILGRRWLILVAMTLIGVASGLISSKAASSTDAKVEQSYVASETLVVNRGAVAVSVSQDELRVTRGDVPRLAAKILDYDGSPTELATKMKATADTARLSITIETTDKDKKLAERRVAAFVQAFDESTSGIAAAQQDVLRNAREAELKGAEDALKAFDEEHPELTADDFTPDGTARTATLIQQRNTLLGTVEATKLRNRQADVAANTAVPYQRLGPNETTESASGLLNVPASPSIRGVLVGFMGFVIGGIIVMLVERVNRRIDTRDELADLINLPILVEVGYIKDRRRPYSDNGEVLLMGVWAESYRRVRSAIQFVQASQRVPGPDGTDRPPSVFMITSTSPGEGKSTSTALTALALAEVGVPTLVVGGDFRKPMVDRFLGVRSTPSIQDYARLDIDRPSVDDVVHLTPHESLYVAPAGNATREVAPLVDAAREVIEIARERGATVIIDSSPLQAANDTLDLLPVVDYVILVLRSGRSDEADLLDTIETLNRMGTKILGLILLGTPIGRKQAYYYDYYAPPSDMNGVPLVPGQFPAAAPPVAAPTNGVAPDPTPNGSAPVVGDIEADPAPTEVSPGR